MLKPYWENDSGRLYLGHVIDVLKEFPDESVHCVVTSPPYWGLRDYGIEPQVWDDPGDCQHEWGKTGPEHHPGQVKDNKAVTDENAKGQTAGSGQFCSHCRAWRGSLGFEPTPELYTEHLVQVFAEIKRVMRKDGTLWLNLGDSYNGSGGDHKQGEGYKNDAGFQGKLDRGVQKKNLINLKPKDLVGIPWRTAFALQANGWWLRSDIIWHKPNCMPSSVKDRPTTAHEYIFMLTKSAKYYFDQDVVREPIQQASIERDKAGWNAAFKGRHTMPGEKRPHSTDHNGFCNPSGRNIRSVWTVPTQPYKDAHFATFPTKLIRPAILAGCPHGGIVLDPFIGSGTTGEVARMLGRRWVGIELGEKYAEMVKKRMIQNIIPL